MPRFTFDANARGRRSDNMKQRCKIACLLFPTLLLAPGLAFAQASQDNRTLVITGLPGSVPVIQLYGRSYVDLEGLARVTNSSLSFTGNQVNLTLPGTSAPAAPPPANQGFSRDFMRTAIEAAATIREWHSALSSAIQNGYPISADAFTPFRNQATTAMRLASVAATTSSDQNAAQLLNNLLANVGKLSDKYVAMRANLSFIDRNALQSDSLDQKIVNCGRSLGAMAASGQFSDDGSCH
jgi:hypothetical protein